MNLEDAKSMRTSAKRVFTCKKNACVYSVEDDLHTEIVDQRFEEVKNAWVTVQTTHEEFVKVSEFPENQPEMDEWVRGLEEIFQGVENKVFAYRRKWKKEEVTIEEENSSSSSSTAAEGNGDTISGDEDVEMPRITCTKRFMIFLKLLSEVCEIICETWILVDKIIPNLNNLESVLKVTTQNESSINPTSNARVRNVDSNSYKDAAYTYIAFYILGLLSVLAYWITTYKYKKTPSGLAILMAFVCEMPLMVAEMCMLKAEGVINWNDQLADLILQICFLINVFIQIYFDILRIWRERGFRRFYILAPILILVIDFVITCILYAPIMWAIAGWHWFRVIRMSHIKGIITSPHAENALDVLILVGQIGQWIISFIIVGIILWLLVKCFCRRSGNRKINPET